MEFLTTLLIIFSVFAISFVILFGFELNVSIQKAKTITKRKYNLLAKKAKLEKAKEITE